MDLHATLSLHNVVRIIVTKPHHLEGTNSNTNDVILEGKDGTRVTVSIFSKTGDHFEVINLMDKKNELKSQLAIKNEKSEMSIGAMMEALHALESFENFEPFHLKVGELLEFKKISASKMKKMTKQEWDDLEHDEARVESLYEAAGRAIKRLKKALDGEEASHENS